MFKKLKLRRWEKTKKAEDEKLGCWEGGMKTRITTKKKRPQLLSTSPLLTLSSSRKLLSVSRPLNF